MFVYSSATRGLFFLYRRNHHYHPLALELRHLLCASVLLEFHCKAEKKLLALVGIDDGASSEEYRGLDLGAFLKKFARVLELELEIMLVGVWPETDFLDDYLGGVGLHFLCLLLLLVEELLIVDDLAYRRISLSTDLNQIQTEFISHLHGR